MTESDSAKAQVLEGVHLLFEARVMQHSGHGNASMRLPGNRMVITTVPVIRDLNDKDLAVVAFDGTALEGTLDPVVAEIVLMHSQIYANRPDVASVFHTHSPHATAFALANVPLPSDYESMLRYGFTAPIPVAEWAPRGSAESVRNIVSVVSAHPGLKAVLLANHGLLAFSTDPIATAQLVVVLEEGATATLAAQSIGGTKPLPADALVRERAHMAQFGSLPANPKPNGAEGGMLDEPHGR
jgi:L-ribulose-5-phosphate 4-epimerase